MPDRQIKFQSDNVMADVCLGVTIVGTECLLAIGLVLAFAN